MLAPGRPSSSRQRTGLPFIGPWSVSRMSKWASRVIRPTSPSGRPSACAAGRVTALLPPSRRVRSCARGAARERRRGSARSHRPASAPCTGDVAGIAHGEIELQPGHEIVGAEPLAAPAAPSPARGRSGRASPSPPPSARRAGRPARAASSVSRSAIDFQLMLCPYTRLALEGEPCGTACSSTATSPPWTRPCRARSARSRMARSASRTGGSSGSGGGPSWPAIRRRRSSRWTAPG